MIGTGGAYEILVVALMIIVTFAGCGKKDSPNTLTVLNYGKYLEPKVLEQFEEETGIKVEYEEYITPENMYTKFKAGAIDYDLICTSDYMIEKLIQEQEVAEMDFDKFLFLKISIRLILIFPNPLIPKINIRSPIFLVPWESSTTGNS